MTADGALIYLLTRSVCQIVYVLALGNTSGTSHCQSYLSAVETLSVQLPRFAAYPDSTRYTKKPLTTRAPETRKAAIPDNPRNTKRRYTR